MTVSDIAVASCLDCADTGATMLAFAKAQLRMRYEILYNAYNWKEAMADPPQEFDLAAPVLIPSLPGASTSISYMQTLALPLSYDKVIWVKGSQDGGASFPYELKPRDRGWDEHNDGSAFLTATTPQIPRYFYHGQPRGFPTISPGIITFTPLTSAGNFQLTIEGLDVNGLEQSETFSISGTTPVSTANSYREVHNIAKSIIPTAAMTVAPAVGTAVTMGQNDENLRYTTLIVWPAYNGPFRLRIGAKLKIDPILNDTSIPRISGLFQALYWFTRAAIKGRQKQGDAEASDIAMAQNLFMQAKNDEMSQSGAFMQIQPKIFDDPGQVWDWYGSVN
jgi:hypothetical protein